MCSKEALSILVPVLGTPTPPRRALRSLSPGSTWAPSSFLTLWVLESQLSLGWLRAVERSLVRAEADGCLQHQAQLQIGFPAQAQQEQPLENH